MSLLSELQRRNVFRVGAAYVVAAWLVIQVADILLPTFNAPQWAMQGLILVSIAGFPVVLILAWVYELTPKGIKRTEKVPASESVTRWTGRKLDFITIGLLFFALLAVVIDNYVLERSHPDNAGTAAVENRSIAVLPFENRSAAEENAEFFADGLHDDLLTMLSRISDLKVISRTSVERFRNTTQSTSEIAAALGVATVLEGGVQRAGDRVRINVQLIDARTDQHLWADTYDRELTVADVFDIQAETATAIANALQIRLTSQEQQQLATAPTESTKAYEAYLLGRHRMAQMSSAGFVAADEYFQQSIDLDPSFALPYVGLADSLTLQVQSEDLAPQPALERADTLIKKALDLDPNLAEAYSALGDLHLARFEYEDAEAAFIRALEINPSYVQAAVGCAVLLAETLRFADAVDYLEKALQVDPLSAETNDYLGFALAGLGQLDKALERYERAIEIDPNFPLAYWHIGQLHILHHGRLDEGVRWHAKSLSIDPSDVSRVARHAYDYMSLGDVSRAKIWADRAYAIAPETYIANEAMAFVHLFRNEYEKAAEYAMKATSFDPLFPWGATTILRDHDLRAGRYVEARAHFESRFPELLSTGEPDVGLVNVFAAIDLVPVLYKTNEDVRAKRILNQSLAIVRQMPRWRRWIGDAQIYAMQGDKQAALLSLRDAIDQGWRLLWWFVMDYDLTLDSLRGETEFQAMRAEIQAEMAAQLERVLEMERNGELPSIAEVSAATQQGPTSASGRKRSLRP